MAAANHLPIYKPLEYPYQGDDYVIRFRIKNTTSNEYVDLTDAEGKCQVKTKQDRSSELILEFAFASTADDLTNGTVIFVASHALMANTRPGTFYYDCQLTKNLEVKTFLYGPFKITAEVTT